MKNGKLLTYKGAVVSNECDSNEHMNVMYYIQKFELAARNYAHEMGITKRLLEAHNLGFVVTQQLINYHNEAFEDEVLFVESYLTRIGNKSFTLIHDMQSAAADKQIATMEAIAVLLDKVTRKAVPIPDPVRTKMESMLPT